MVDYAESTSGSKVKALVDFFGYISDPRIYVNAGRLPPTLILHNKDDEVVKVVASSQPLLDALKRTKVPHDHRFYDDGWTLVQGHRCPNAEVEGTRSRLPSTTWRPIACLKLHRR